MSRKADMLAALQRRQPADRVPLWELEFHIWDQASGKHVILGREFEKLTSAQQEEALHTNAEIILSVSEDMQFSAVTVPGRFWEVAPGEPAYYWLPDEAHLRQLQILRKMAGDIVLVVGAGGVMCMPGALEYEDFAIKLFEAPDEIEARAQNGSKRGIERLKLVQDHGADAVFTASDIADNHGPFFNPAQMDRFILPFAKLWANAAHELGMPCIFHSDGNLMPVLESLASTGVDALQAIDPVAGMDIMKVRDLARGRLCLCGNVDCGLLLTGTPDQVYAATTNLLNQVKPGGAFVLGASNAVDRATPVQNYRALTAAHRDHGKYH